VTNPFQFKVWEVKVIGWAKRPETNNTKNNNKQVLFFM